MKCLFCFLFFWFFDLNASNMHISHTCMCVIRYIIHVITIIIPTVIYNACREGWSYI